MSNPTATNTFLTGRGFLVRADEAIIVEVHGPFIDGGMDVTWAVPVYDGSTLIDHSQFRPAAGESLVSTLRSLFGPSLAESARTVGL